MKSPVTVVIAKLHDDQWTIAHFNPKFLPWHRAYLRTVEDLLQEQLGPTFALPYWDWTLDATEPDKSMLLTSGFYGSRDNTTFTIVDSGLAGMKVKYSTDPIINKAPHLLKRPYTIPMSPFNSRSYLNSSKLAAMSFSEWSREIENVPHANVHVGLGGADGLNGDMKSPFAPYDLLFFGHHAVSF